MSTLHPVSYLPRYVPDKWLLQQYERREREDALFAMTVAASVIFFLGVFIGTLFISV